MENQNKSTEKPYTIHGVSYRFHPQTGYDDAKKWLQEIGKWEYVSTHGFSTDGWSIIATANTMWDKRNGG